MKNLYELNKDFLELLEDVEAIQPTEDDPDCKKQMEEMKKRFDELEGGIDIKFENTGKYIRMLETSLEQIGDEIKRLNDLKKSREKKIQSKIDFLLFIMTTQGLKEKETQTFTFKLKKNPAKLEVKNEEEVLKMIPEEMKTWQMHQKDDIEFTEDVRDKLEELGFGFDQKYNKTDLKSWINTKIDGEVYKEVELIPDYATKKKKDQVVVREKIREKLLEKYKDIYEFVQSEKLDIK